MSDIRVPDGLWDTDKNPEGIIANWFYADGATISKGSVVAELMVEKSTYEIEAPADGVLTRTIAKDGVVQPGSVIGTVDAG